MATEEESHTLLGSPLCFRDLTMAGSLSFEHFEACSMFVLMFVLYYVKS